MGGGGETRNGNKTMGALDVEKNLFSFTHRDDSGRQCRSISFTSAVQRFVHSFLLAWTRGEGATTVPE